MTFVLLSTWNLKPTMADLRRSIHPLSQDLEPPFGAVTAASLLW